MLRQERQDPNLTVVKPTKHFISITSADANNYNTDGFNPADLRITFNNPQMTNVSSAKDATYTTLTPITLYGDCYYYNVSPNFNNHKFRILSSTGQALSSTIGGVANTRENSVNPAVPANWDPTTFPEVTLNEGMYNAIELGAEIFRALNASTIGWYTAGGATPIVWTNTAVDGTGRLRLAYATAAPAGTPDLYFYTTYTNSAAIDSSRILGTTFAVFGATNVYGAFILTYANRVAGMQTPKIVDIKTVQQVQVHCSCAGRHFIKRGYAADGFYQTNAGLRPLTMTDILFTFDLSVDMGSTFVFEPTSYDIYEQQVSNNFDEFRLYLTTNKGQIIKFVNNAEMSFTFAIQRQYITPSAEDRIKDLMTYNAFRN